MARDPRVSDFWQDRPVPVEPVRASNRRGTIGLGKFPPLGPTSIIYVNLVDIVRLDTARGGYTPVGRAVENGMTVVDGLYGGYGDHPPRGSGPPRDSVRLQGESYLAAPPLLCPRCRLTWSFVTTTQLEEAFSARNLPTNYAWKPVSARLDRGWLRREHRHGTDRSTLSYCAAGIIHHHPQWVWGTGDADHHRGQLPDRQRIEPRVWTDRRLWRPD